MSREVYLPRNLDEFRELRDRRPYAALYAGGTDLLVRMRQGLLDPPALICLERIEVLKKVEDREGLLFLGAGATHAELLEHPAVRRRLPVLARALEVLGSPPIRHMGTIGGNIVTASPAGDTLPPLYTLDAEVEILSSMGSRRRKINEFILGPGRTDLKPGELLLGVLVPVDPAFHLHHFEKVGPRNALAIALVSLAALLSINDSGLIEKAKLAWGSVGPTVVTSAKVEAALVGRPLTRDTLEEAAALARAAVSPIDDLRADAEYRRAVAGNLVLRLINYTRRPGPAPAL
ncbi:MAG: xanthine dehydrogenase family protein subunit M [Thermodesulfobacteriota bacterium]